MGWTYKVKIRDQKKVIQIIAYFIFSILGLVFEVLNALVEVMDEIEYFNETYEEAHNDSTSSLDIIIYTFTFLSFMPIIIIDVGVIYIIKSYKDMRIKRNIFVLNWCINDLLYQTMLIVELACALKCEFYIGLCIVYTLDVIFEMFGFIIMLGFFVDFIYDRLTETRLKLTIIIVWSTLALYSLTESIFCIIEYFTFYYFSVLFGLHILIYAVFILKCCFLIVNKFRKISLNEEQRFRYILTTVFVCYQLIHSIVLNVHGLNVFLHFFEQTQMIVFIIVLMYLDVNFKYCFINLFTCRRPNHISVKYNKFDVEVEINSNK